MHQIEQTAFMVGRPLCRWNILQHLLKLIRIHIVFNNIFLHKILGQHKRTQWLRFYLDLPIPSFGPGLRAIEGGTGGMQAFVSGHVQTSYCKKSRGIASGPPIAGRGCRIHRVHFLTRYRAIVRIRLLSGVNCATTSKWLNDLTVYPNNLTIP